MHFRALFPRRGRGVAAPMAARVGRTELQMESLEDRLVLSTTPELAFSCDQVFDRAGNELAVMSALPAPEGASSHGGGCHCGVCAGLSAQQSDPASGSGGVSFGQPAFDASQAFKLHSRAGANHRIYLDFDGHVTTSTSWNSSYGSTITTPAYDTDGNPASFSTAELQNIFNIWQRVAEDYAPFDVDVTTEDPGLAALIKSGSGDTQWGVRVAIGGSGSWLGATAGGVAYINSFSWNTDTPAFVFSSNLGNGNEKYVAEAISHEAGHTLGLSHDGSSSTAYYSGQGSGETGWAPLMGVGYYQNVTQWSKGEYSGANNKEDDLAIITGGNGFTYRADDYGNTTSGAGALSASGASVGADGVIEQSTDVDFFYFDTGSGAVTISASPAPRGPNLDIRMDLYDSSGRLVATSNPDDSLSASVTANLAAGRYYVKIDGVGSASGGYSDYASLGQYSISGTVVATTSPPPVSPPPVSPPPVSPPPVSPPPVSPPPVSPPPVTLTPDRYESNDNLSSATNLGKGNGFSQTVLNLHSSTDADFYKFVVNKSGVFSVTVSPSGSGSVTVEVLNAQGAVLSSDASSLGTAGVTLSLQSNTTYYVRVTSPTGSAVGYDLSITASSGGGSKGAKGGKAAAMGAADPGASFWLPGREDAQSEVNLYSWLTGDEGSAPAASGRAVAAVSRESAGTRGSGPLAGENSRILGANTPSVASVLGLFPSVSRDVFSDPLDPDAAR